MAFSLPARRLQDSNEVVQDVAATEKMEIDKAVESANQPALDSIIALESELGSVAVVDSEKHIELEVDTPNEKGHVHLNMDSIVGVRLLVASNVDGPWKSTWSTPYENAGLVYDPTKPDAPFPHLQCNNPAALQNADDGSVLLYCKWATRTEKKQGSRGFRIAVFKAAEWKGPYKFQAMLSPHVSGEDAYVWYSKKRQAYHMIYHR